MADFDWRPVIYLLTIAVFTLLWLVGCTILTGSGTRSAPTASPEVTLTVGRIVESALPTNAPTPSDVPPTRSSGTNSHPNGSPSLSPTLSDDAASVSSSNLSSEIDHLHLTPPVCYETLTRTIHCLGRVDNTLNRSIGGISLNVRLYQRGGESAEMTSVIEQAVIPPNAFAPYRVDFNESWSSYAGIAVEFASGSVVTGNTYTTPPIRSTQIDTGIGIRTVSALVDVPEGVRLSRVIVSLIDSYGRIMGYQVLRYEETQRDTDDSLVPVQAIIIPQIDLPDLRPVIYAEARRR
ncbi:MAG: hypothetical protein U0670_11490 [Anaerolineae bacterium]